MSGCYLGLDAGATKTVALVADATGRVLGRGRSASGDVYSADDAEGEVVAAVERALAGAGASAADVRHAALRLAGVDWPEDEAYWAAVVDARLPGLGSRSIKNDGFSLLRCAGPGGVGLAVTAGTGPAVAARGHDGREWSACWWIQHPLGGRALGRAAFAAVVDAELGTGPATSLTRELLALHDSPDVESMLHAATRREPLHPVPDEPAAARPALRAAGAGDGVATGIVEEQARGFARLGAAAVRRTGLDAGGPVRCVLGGVPAHLRAPGAAHRPGPRAGAGAGCGRRRQGHRLPRDRGAAGRLRRGRCRPGPPRPRAPAPGPAPGGLPPDLTT